MVTGTRLGSAGFSSSPPPSSCCLHKWAAWLGWVEGPGSAGVSDPVRRLSGPDTEDGNAFKTHPGNSTQRDETKKPDESPPHCTHTGARIFHSPATDIKRDVYPVQGASLMPLFLTV